MRLSTKHTPAPWVDVGIESDYPRERNIKAGNLYIARTIGGLSAETELANAHLISAAPDLLYALESIVEMNPELPMGMIEAAKATIAKATGEEV